MSRFAQKTGQHGPFTKAIDIIEASIEQETELDTAFVASQVSLIWLTSYPVVRAAVS